MSKSPSKESDIPAFSHIAFFVEHHSSIVDSACDARQNSPSSILSRAGFFPESSLQETSIDLQSALTLFLSRINKVESNTAKVTKTNNLQEIITAQELDKVLVV